MPVKRLFITTLLIMAALFSSSCAAVDTAASSSGGTQKGEAAMVKTITPDTSILTVMNEPSFKEFGQFLFPTDFYTPTPGMKVSDAGSLLPYHTHINASDSCNVLNYLLNQARSGRRVFYNIYSEEARKLNPELEKTGLFFFRGRPDAPFAVICAGGGFAYVGSIHESFPHALELSKKGYNAFALLYRTGSAQKACDDLAAALTLIFKNAAALNINTNSYSLWGGSAGARMAAYLGSYGAEAFGGAALPKPAAVIMQYTGHTDYTPDDPPTYACAGNNDGIASWRTMQCRLDNLNRLGIETEFHKYPHLGHGFGLGRGTSAEGWLNDAAAFWQRQIDKQKSN